MVSDLTIYLNDKTQLSLQIFHHVVQPNSSVTIKDALMVYNVVMGNQIVMTAVMKMDVVCV